MIRALLMAVAVCLIVAPSVAVAGAERAAEPERGPLLRLWLEVQARLEAITPPPPPVPPTPTPVRWKQRSVGEVELGAPLVELGAQDLDGDGKWELIALTTREVIALHLSGGSVEPSTRALLPVDPPQRRPRDPVGAMVITSGDNGVRVRVRTSEQGTGLVLGWRAGKFVPVDTQEAYPLCEGLTVKLSPGRNVFAGDTLRGTWPQGITPVAVSYFAAARCRVDLVDANGRIAAVVAVVADDGQLSIRRAVPCDSADHSCKSVSVGGFSLEAVGVAFALADVNTDGFIDVVTSTNAAPGRGDRIDVYTSNASGELLRLFRTAKLVGGVVGLAVADLDGDGDVEVVAATRVVGSTRIELWTLN